jgi:TRAP-type C4-dicarboxylate transport system permease small subunit
VLHAPVRRLLIRHGRTMLSTIRTFLQRAAESVAAALLAIIFVAFILQIVLRYVFNSPVGWTAELSVVAWLWLVLWGAAFVLKDHEEIRIDFVAAKAGRRTRVVMRLIGSAAIVVLFGMSLPAAWDYVSFMKVEKSSYLNTRFDVLFSIYIIFSVAVIARHGWTILRLLRGQDPSYEEAAPSGPTP